MKKSIGLLFLLYLVTASFRNGEGVSIRITSPSPGSEFAGGDTIRIRAELSSAEALHDVSIRVITVKDSMTVYSRNIHSHATSVSVNEFFVFPVPVKQELRLIIKTSGHGGETVGHASTVFTAGGKKTRK